MKNTIFALIFLAIGLPAFGQENEELELIRYLFQLEKAALLVDYLDLPQDELDILSPIYTDYETERRSIGNQRIRILKRYAEQYKQLSDKQADVLVKEFFVVQKSTVKLHQKYYKKVKKRLGSSIAIAFVQFEQFIENTIRSALWEDIPFVEAKK